MKRSDSVTIAARRTEEDQRVKTILIVEDDRQIAVMLFIRLKAHDYEVITGHDAATGLRLCREHLPDRAILDICLSGSSGLDLAIRIKDIPQMAGRPIIFMTANSKPEFLTKAAELGAAAFIEKPFDDAELIAAVRQALGEAPPVEQRMQP